LAIAMALAHDPDLLIADEATTALDVTVQQEILALLEQLCEGGGRSLLFVTHDLALAARLCRRVLVMYAGRIVEDAPLQRLLTRPAHPYTHALIACSPELGQPDKPLAAIAGQPPAPGTLTRGCRFAPRCPRVQPACLGREPALAPLGATGAAVDTVEPPGPQPSATAAGHRVRCLFPMEDA
jgi:oligopeptide/dipeptide ABC transporter ATP-binding protein